MTSNSNQIIGDLIAYELSNSQSYKFSHMDYDIEEVETHIKSTESEIKSLRKKIEKLSKKRKNLLEQKKRETKKIKQHVRQKLQTFEGFVEYLPSVRPGRRWKWRPVIYGSGINAKQMRDRMLVEELKRRQAKNPKRPMTSEANQKETHANDLAKELANAGIPRVGYHTIKNAWRTRDKI